MTDCSRGDARQNMRELCSHEGRGAPCVLQWWLGLVNFIMLDLAPALS